MNTYLLFWFIIATIAAFFELGHPGLFYFLSATIAGILTGLCSLWIESFEYQTIFFFITLLLACPLLRYLLIKRLQPRTHYHSNIHALQGQKAYVVEPIAQGKQGLVKIGGELWAARAIHTSEQFNRGETVEVVHVAGAHVRVKKTS